jgi:hypothetical protein
MVASPSNEALDAHWLMQANSFHRRISSLIVVWSPTPIVPRGGGSAVTALIRREQRAQRLIYRLTPSGWRTLDVLILVEDVVRILYRLDAGQALVRGAQIGGSD